MSSYTLSYEDDLGDIGNLVDIDSLYDDVLPSDDVTSVTVETDDVTTVTVETDAGCKIAKQLDFG